ncbi:TolC family protein [Ferrimonas gelatinilytica]|uniref:TolC family protein n=1 Tax=Ferrimonas gelatinilytica TaxID=1255257 RepID=A0ABP9SFA9_9GAMM
MGLAAAPLSLLEAWQHLDSDSAALQAEREASRRAESERQAADALGGPSLSLGATYLYLDQPVSLDLSGTLPSILPPGLISPVNLTERSIYRTSLRGQWPLYAGGRIDAAQAVKQAEMEAQKQQLEIRRREQFNLLVERYYGVLLAKQNAQLRQAQVTARRSHARNARLLEEQGQIARVERLNAEVALEQAQVAARQADSELRIAQRALASLLRQEGGEPMIYGAERLSVPPVAPLEQALVETHPALKLFDAKERQAQGAIKAEKGRYKPELGLFGTYTLLEDDSLLSDLEPEWMVGVRFTMPLVTNDGRRDRVKAARSAELEARHRRAQAEQDLRLLLVSQHEAMRQAADQFESYYATIALAQENRHLRQEAFSQGLATSLELVDADQSLTAAQLGQAFSRYQYLKALAQVMSLSGQIEPFFSQISASEIAQ